jgi:hypothetical protein
MAFGQGITLGPEPCLRHIANLIYVEKTNERHFLCLLVLIAFASVTLSTHTAPTSAGGNVASANGSGHNGNLTLSFGAFDHGAGNFTGQATFIDDATRTKVTIDVECVIVSSNTAKVGGTVLRSSNPSFAPGDRVSFRVVDNGEGVGAIADQFTPPYLEGCGVELMELAPLPSNTGNIQVRFVAQDRDCTKCPAGTHCAGNGECVGGGGGTVSQALSSAAGLGSSPAEWRQS